MSMRENTVLACRRAVLETLKAPDTAKFPGFMDEVPPPTVAEDGSEVWRAWVTAMNPMGVPLRKRFTCIREPGGTALLAWDDE